MKESGASATLHKALNNVFQIGFKKTADAPLMGPSGLLVLKFTSEGDGIFQQSKMVPDDTFVVGINMKKPRRATMQKNGKPVRFGVMRPGTVIFSEPGHCTEGETDGAWEALFLMIPHRLIATVCEMSEFPIGGIGTLNFLNSEGRIDGRLLALGRESLREIAEPGPFARLRADLIGQEIIIRMLTQHSTLAEPVARERARLARGGLSPGQLRRASEIMDAFNEQDLTLDVLGAAVGCSPTHFSRAFKQSTGMPPFAWILHRRIERAQEMLIQGAMPIAQIALAVGFSAQPQFTTAFRRVTGSTPAAWRKAHYY